MRNLMFAAGALLMSGTAFASSEVVINAAACCGLGIGCC
jgi:hypothetical protein